MTLPILWFIIIAVLICAYYVLDGFDLGAGVLSPFIAKTPGEKRALMTSIGPVWDGNEVWLLTAAARSSLRSPLRMRPCFPVSTWPSCSCSLVLSSVR